MSFRKPPERDEASALPSSADRASKFTAGPWRVLEKHLPHDLGGHHVERMIVTAWDHPQLKGPEAVVRLSSGRPEKPNEPWVMFCNIDEPDARLIAAAPDLYEALQEARKTLDDCECVLIEHSVGHAVLEYVQAAMKQAGAALAKASPADEGTSAASSQHND